MSTSLSRARPRASVRAMRMAAPVLLALPIVTAGAAHATDLLDIYKQAVNQDARLSAAQAGFQAAEERRPQAVSALLPQLNLGGQYAREELDSTQEIDIDDDPNTDAVVQSQAGSFSTDGYTLRLDQVVYDHALILRLRQSGPSIAQAQAELDAVAQGLIVRVSEAYFNVLAARDNLEFARAEKNAIARQLEQAQEQFEVGVIAITDVKEAQAAFDRAIAQVVDARNRLVLNREALRVITGEVAANLNRLGETLPLVSPEPADIDAWVATAMRRNLRLLAREFATETADFEVGLRRARHYPSLGLFVEKSANDTGGGIFGASQIDDEVIGIELNMPLFSGGFVSSRIEEASYRLEQARDLEELQRRETVRQTRASYLSVIAGISQVTALRRALESNQAATAAARVGFEVGTRTSLDVLLALRELFRTQRDLSRARYDYLLDTLRLKQAAGTLSVEDLVALNAWLS
ncbi:MAG: TolC family outer membrane protein [Pseudomonadota bacterium]|nr:TolC family outer membrane protein [Pseudomonadota bacterium]